MRRHWGLEDHLPETGTEGAGERGTSGRKWDLSLQVCREGPGEQTLLTSLSSFLPLFYLNSALAGPTRKPEGKKAGHFQLFRRLQKGRGV